MPKRVLLSVLMSVGIVVGGFGVAYALGTFNAIQQGFRQGGAGEAAKITMTVEAGVADANSEFLPDSNACGSFCPGGSLAFAITNTSDFPIRVTKIQQTQQFCIVNGNASQCPVQWSNKDSSGSYSTPPTAGTCANDLLFTAPTEFRGWPTIGPHSTLQVNGTDNNQLGAGMIHLTIGTPDGCQGALFTVGLTITATEAVPNGSINQ